VTDPAFVLYKILGTLLVPPGAFALSLILFAAIAFRRPRKPFLGGALFVSGVLFFLLCLPATARLVTGTLEHAWKAVPPPENRRWAVVVLGGGIHLGETPEDATPGAHTLERLFGAWELLQDEEWPVIFCGAATRKGFPSEAKIMEATLRKLGWRGTAILDENSRTTWENLTAARDHLGPLKAEGVILVTNAFHMPRAYETALRILSVPVHPYPAGYLTDKGSLTWYEFLPQGGAFLDTLTGFRERIGAVAYRFFR
jgi:uncharacterized SAM-binding protein YcdF (DUF218 family)